MRDHALIRKDIRTKLSEADADLSAVWHELGQVRDSAFLEDIFTEAIILQIQSEKLLDYVSKAVA